MYFRRAMHVNMPITPLSPWLPILINWNKCDDSDLSSLFNRIQKHSVCYIVSVRLENWPFTVKRQITGIIEKILTQRKTSERMIKIQKDSFPLYLLMVSLATYVWRLLPCLHALHQKARFRYRNFSENRRMPTAHSTFSYLISIASLRRLHETHTRRLDDFQTASLIIVICQ